MMNLDHHSDSINVKDDNSNQLNVIKFCQRWDHSDENKNENPINNG